MTSPVRSYSTSEYCPRPPPSIFFHLRGTPIRCETSKHSSPSFKLDLDSPRAVLESRAAMVLCRYCQSITIEGLICKDEERRSYHGMNHQPSFSALVESARTCELCRLFHASILEGVCDEHSTDPGGDGSFQQLRVHASGRKGEQGQPAGDGFSDLQLRSITIMDKPLNYLGILEIFAEQGMGRLTCPFGPS